MNEIPNNQDVTDESGFLEDAKFVVEPLLQLIIRFRSVAVAPLQTLRAKLAQNRSTCPLFNTDLFRRHIEAAYMKMCDIWRRGQAPRSFQVGHEPGMIYE